MRTRGAAHKHAHNTHTHIHIGICIDIVLKRSMCRFARRLDSFWSQEQDPGPALGLGVRFQGNWYMFKVVWYINDCVRQQSTYTHRQCKRLRRRIFLDFRDFLVNSRFYYINGPRDKFIQVDMILNYIFRLGLRGKCLHRCMINPREVGALRAPTSWGFLKHLWRHFPRSPRRKI